MSPCEPFAEAVLDEAAVKPEGFAAHLQSCEACRALRDGHRAAGLLHGRALHRSTRMPVARIMLRAALAAGAVMIVLLVVSIPRGDEPQPDVAAAFPSTEVPLEHAPMRAAPSESESLLALAQLSQTVSDYARVDPVTHGYGPQWKSLPLLVAPSVLQPMHVFTSEE